MAEIVDTQLFLYVGNFGDHRLEAVLAEKLVFVVLKFFPQRVIFMTGYELPECGEQHGVLAGLVRAVHRIEGSKQTGQPLHIRVAESRILRQLQYLVGNATPGIVLAEQGVYEIGELASLPKTGEQIVFLLLLMIVFDKAADNTGGSVQRGQIGGHAGRDRLPPVIIDQQYPIEQPVFLHQVLGWRDFFFFPFPAGTACQKSRAGQADKARLQAPFDEVPATGAAGGGLVWFHAKIAANGIPSQQWIVVYLSMNKYFFIVGFMAFIACNSDGRNNAVLQSRIDSLQKKLDDAYKPGLGEFMSGIQVHHAKLWFAGTAGNWKLADFEVGEIKESLDDIEKYCTDRPEITSLPMIRPPLDSVNAAVSAGNEPAFRTAFIQLTATCNNCHRATKHEFNVIKVPDTPPFTNQVFSKQQ